MNFNLDSLKYQGFDEDKTVKKMSNYEILNLYIDSQRPGEFQRRTHISLKNKYVYIPLGKVAHTSLQMAVFKKELIGTPFQIQCEKKNLPAGLNRGHPHTIAMPTIKPYQIDKETLMKCLTTDEFSRWAFVRNPYSRFLSLFIHKFIKKRKKHDPQLTFQEFADQVAQENPLNMNPHYRPQSLILRPDILKFHYIGKFEKLESDINNIDKLIKGPGFGEFLPHLGTTTNASQLINKYYTPEIKSIIDKIYYDDFVNFGYEMVLDSYFFD